MRYSIVGYRSFQIEWKTNVVEQGSYGKGDIQNVTASVEIVECRYRRWVTVDLWIVVLNFEWESDWVAYEPDPNSMF